MVNTPLTLVAGNPTVNSDRWWSWLLYSFSFTGNPKRDRHLRTAAGVWLLDNFNKLFFLSFFLILDKLWNNELQCDMLPTILLCEFCLSNALSCCSHRTVRLLPPLSVFTTRCACKHTDTCMWGILFCCFFRDTPIHNKYCLHLVCNHHNFRRSNFLWPPTSPWRCVILIV